MTAEEFVKKQELMAKQYNILSDVLKTHIKTEWLEGTAIQQLGAKINQQVFGNEVVDILKEFQYVKLFEGSKLYKQLQPTISQLKLLGDNDRFYESLHLHINDNLGGALKQMSSLLADYKISSLQGFSSGLQELKDNLDKLDLYGLMKETYCDTEESETEEGFTSNEEIIEALEENEKNPVGFQEKVYNWSEKKKRQYCIVFSILFFIYSIFLEPYLQENVGKPVMAWTVAHIKELPEKASEFVTDLKKDIEATIIENVPYYYKVSFVDENGVYREGYVSKRSVKLIETTDEEEIEE